MTQSTLKNSKGLSLVEVMIATFIFGFLALAIVQSILYVRQKAQDQVWQITALTVATGYIEQMKGMDVVSLTQDTIPTEISQGLPDPLVANTWPDDADSDSLTNRKLIDIRNTPDNETDDMIIEFNPSVTELNDNEAPRIEIVLNYRWIPASERVLKKGTTKQSSLRLIRSLIPNDNDPPSLFE